MSLPTFGYSTTAEEVATIFSKEIRGKNVLITGTSLNSLGFETARVIAQHANLVIIAGYNSERLALSEKALKREVPSANIRCLRLDLSSLAAVRKAAAEVIAYREPLHVLIHNAAAVIGPFKLSADKLESQVATAFIGPFLLTKLLAKKIMATKTPWYTPRVVILTSYFHEYAQGIDLVDIQHPDRSKYDAFGAYNQAKSANVLFAAELSRRIIDAEGQPNRAFSSWKTIEQGAATTVVAAFDTRLEYKPGAYLNDCKEAVIAGPNISDPDLPGALWAVAEKIIGEPFAF
ncbi:NAD-P-binding protein [Mycena rebaudengoi]|nr:NAD-P-binding protein [Mycena rebaudengoi]